MPVKALPLPWAWVSGVYNDGTAFRFAIDDPIAPVDVVKLPWFEPDLSTVKHVARIDAFEYTGKTPFQWGADDDWRNRPIRRESDRDPKRKPIPAAVHPIPRDVAKASNFSLTEEFKAWELITFEQIDVLKLNDQQMETAKRLADKRTQYHMDTLT